MHTPTILVIDDNHILRKVTRIALEVEGFLVIEGADAATARAIVAREPPDLILQDLILPDSNGFDLVRQLRQLLAGRKTPIIAMTGLVSRAGEAHSLVDAFDQVLSKPVEPAQLVRLVRDYLPVSSEPRHSEEPRHILLVDDDPVQLELTRLHLVERGFRVSTARDGLEAFDVARSEPPDAILSDVMMPGADGFALCRSVRKDARLRQLPLYLMSSRYVDEADRSLALHAGANGLVTRTSDIEGLVDRLAFNLGSSPAVPRTREDAELDHEHLHRVTRQLERQVQVNAELFRRCALQTGLVTIVRRLSEALGKQADFGRALEEALYTLLDVVAAAVAALYVIDPNGRATLSVQIGKDAAESLRLQSPALLGEIHRATEYKLLEAGGRGEAALSALTANTAMLVPLLAHGRRIGVLLVAFHTFDVTDADRVELTRTIGAHVAQTLALSDAIRTLERSERRYQLLLDNANDAVFVVAFDGLILDVNRQCEVLLQASKRELLGRSVRDFFPEEYHTQAASEFYRKLDEGSNLIIPVVRRDGSRRFVAFSNAPIDVDGEPRLFAIGRDVTENLAADAQRKGLEAQMQQMQKLEAVGQLTGGIAHDFNNILAAILGNSEILVEALPEGDPRRADAKEIQKAGERGASLVRRLLAFSRHQMLEPKVVDLAVVVADMEKMLRLVISANIELSITADSPVGSVRVDVGQIEQVLMNLVVNARDAMASGGRLSIEIANIDLDERYAASHLSLDPGRYVVLSVTDTGCGMDADTRRRAFEPFFTTKGIGKGTGLGLSTTYGIVKQSGGHINVYSEPGRGAVFKVFLPRVDREPTRPRLSARAPDDRRGTETILIVDDDDAVRTVVGRVLLAKGYTVLVANGGRDAAMVATQHDGSIHLVLTDVVMPDQNGPEVLASIRRRFGAARGLLMSGYADGSSVPDGVLPAGASFIQKPFTPGALARKVREVLDSDPTGVGLRA